MSRALQAIVFDFDGVIANSEPLHLRAFQQALAFSQEAAAPVVTPGVSGSPRVATPDPASASSAST